MGQQQKSYNGRLRKKKERYSKFWVAFIISCNMALVIAVMFGFYRTGMEPPTIINAWFGFSSFEMWQMASIKKTKVRKDYRLQNKTINNSYNEQNTNSEEWG